MAKNHEAQLVDALAFAFEPLNQYLEMYEGHLADMGEIGDTPMECLRRITKQRIVAIAEAVEENVGRINIEFANWNYGTGGEISNVSLS
jgi:hypothetical protein